MADVKISEKPPIAAADVTDDDEILFLVSHMNASPSAASKSATLEVLKQLMGRKDEIHPTTLTLSGSNLNWQLNAYTRDNVLFDLGGGSGAVTVNLTITGTARAGEYILYVTNVGTKTLTWATTIWSGTPPQPIAGIQTGFKLCVTPDGTIKGTGFTT